MNSWLDISEIFLKGQLLLKPRSKKRKKKLTMLCGDGGGCGGGDGEWNSASDISCKLSDVSNLFFLEKKEKKKKKFNVVC